MTKIELDYDCRKHIILSFLERTARQGADDTEAGLTTASLSRRVTMADSEPTNSIPTPQLKPAELSALAARLRARAESVLMRDQPEQPRDMLTAVSLVPRLVHLQPEIRRAAAPTEVGP